jgi:mono/diheme cytochrome c family protein
MRVDAQQQRTGKDGVYTAAQATRGEALYRENCVACHGPMLEGLVGPPLAGNDFLGVWAAPPLSDLYDKIHNTMPADKPGSLTPAQTVDIVAFVVQANKFPAGRAALGPDPAALKMVALDPTRGRPSRPAGAVAAGALAGAADFPAVGTLNQIMRGILFPSSNVLFDVQTQDPNGAGQGGTAQAGASATTVRYGNVYSPWQVVDAAAISIAEAAPLLLSPGRRCENGKPAPVDRADWQAAVRGLVDAGKVAYKASQSRNQEAVSDATNVISDACAACHKVYRDRPTAAERCTPLNP